VGLYIKRLHHIKDNSILSLEDKKVLFLDVFTEFEKTSRKAL